jgi:GTP cyclohydrolase I
MPTDEERARGGNRRIDLEAAERAARDLLVALDSDMEDAGMRDTPARVARAFAELLTPEPFEPTTFPNEGYDELVVARDIPFHSLCMHHLLPFHGVAHVAYLPGERIIGLSKLARTVDHHARGAQTQERLTQRVAAHLDQALGARGIGVVIEAEHTCMTLRGARAPGTRTVTSALLGRLRQDPATRSEFLALTRREGRS